MFLPGRMAAQVPCNMLVTGKYLTKWKLKCVCQVQVHTPKYYIFDVQGFPPIDKTSMEVELQITVF